MSEKPSDAPNSKKKSFSERMKEGIGGTQERLRKLGGQIRDDVDTKLDALAATRLEKKKAKETFMKALADNRGLVKVGDEMQVRGASYEIWRLVHKPNVKRVLIGGTGEQERVKSYDFTVKQKDLDAVEAAAAKKLERGK